MEPTEDEGHTFWVKSQSSWEPITYDQLHDLPIEWSNSVRMVTPAKAKEEKPPEPLARQPAGRNDPCPCGSGKKYKRCCKE